MNRTHDEHKPVLLKEVITGLIVKKDGIYVDATFGRGGHAQEILRSLDADGVLLCIDKDQDAIEKARQIGDKRLIIKQGSFTNIKTWIDELGYGGKVNGILLDLGVSSPQLDNPERGFSFLHDGPLDMRMDRSRGRTAADLINFAGRDELILILRKYGEERFAPRIVDSILRRRVISPLNSTAELAAIVKESIPAATRRTGGNPAKRTFQALRIAVNDELEVLTRAIPASMNALSVGGRLVVMSFQSLEDRIVKNFFSAATQSLTPRELPVEIPGLAAKFKLVVKSSETPSSSELTENPRSQSVRLRAIERLAA